MCSFAPIYCYTGRARSLSVASDTIDDIQEETPVPRDPPKRLKKDAEPKPIKGKGKKGKAPEFVATVSWPDHFKELEKVFKVSDVSLWILQFAIPSKMLSNRL